MARPLSRRSIARNIAERLVAGETSSVLAQQLGAYLLQNRRTKELDTILRDVAHHLADAGYVEAEVTVAHEMTPATEKAVTLLVASKTGASSVSLATKIDESVLGGVKVVVPGRELDATIAQQLRTLRTRYKKA